MKKCAWMFILVAGMSWGCIGLFVRTLNAWGIRSMEIVALRSWVTLLAMAGILLVTDPKRFRIKVRDLWCFLGNGLASIVFFNYCYFKTIEYTSLSVAAVLLYTAPAMVMGLSFLFFREKISVTKGIALIMTIFGCVLVTGVFDSSNKVTVIGILTGLGAGLGYALYTVFGRVALQRGYDTFTITFYTFLFASLGSSLFIRPGNIISVMLFSPARLIFGIAFGLVCTVLPYLTYTIGLKYIENGRASIIASIEPVTATLLGILLFKEKITVTEIVGIAVVVAALVVCNGKKTEQDISETSENRIGD